MIDNKLREERDEAIKMLADQRFLDQRNSVSQWLNPDGVVASRYLKADEDEFRVMVSKVFSTNANLELQRENQRLREALIPFAEFGRDVTDAEFARAMEVLNETGTSK